MDVALECIPCALRSCVRLLEEGGVDENRREGLLRGVLRYLTTADWASSPPGLTAGLQAELRRLLGDEDPYREIKERSNLAMLELAPALRDRLARAADPFRLALRLAIAGNVIDFGAEVLLDPVATIDRVLDADLAIDHGERLRRDLAAARTVLYIGDNAGETVLDGLFIETLAHPGLRYVVRGGPVLNDATLADAELAGIPARAKVIDTGDDAPGAILERTSDEFRRAYESASVVVAKGQGNLEGLWDSQRELYFLLTVKCERIADLLGVAVGSFVVLARPAGADGSAR